MAAWRYQLFISSSREAEADAYQGVQDQLNDLGQQGWELTAVIDAGAAKVFILKQPDEIGVDPNDQAQHCSFEQNPARGKGSSVEDPCLSRVSLVRYGTYSTQLASMIT